MKKQTQTILISMIISLLLIGSPVLANTHDPHHSYLFNILVNDPTYGKLNGNYALTMEVLDDNNNVIWTSQKNALFMQGISEFSFSDDSFIKNGASSLRITIPEIEHIDTISLNAVPYATHAKYAKQVHFDNVQDMPSSILFFKDNMTSISDSNTKEIAILNQSKNNNTASSLTLSSDKGDNFVSISSLKNNQGQHKTHISSQDDIEFYRDGKLVLKLGKDSFEMNGYSSLTAADISKMGFINSETQVDDFVKNNGYLKSIDMQNYITSDTLAFAGSNYQTSSASKIGVYDEFNNSDSITVQNVLDDLDQAISNLDITIDEDMIVDIIETNGYIKNTLTESEVDTFVSNNGYASDSSLTTLKNSLGDFAYKNQSEKLNLNEIHIEKLTYGTISQKIEDFKKVVVYKPDNSRGVKYSGVAMMASGWVEMVKGLNELTVELPFNWKGGVINLMCNEEGNSGVHNFMDDDHSSHHFISTYHALSHSYWDNTTVVNTIGNDTSWVIKQDRDHFCNIKRVTPNSFTLFGHRDYNVSVSWWVTAPSKS